ncbi:MAG: ribosome maturation factor RimP [Actinomycetota bacterium]
MAIVDRVRELVLPIVEAESVELYDIEHNGGVLRIFVDDPNRVLGDESTGIDIEVIKRISRGVSHLLDETDPIPGRYTLEVSSPGLERPLRTPEHWRRAVGADVTLKTLPHVEGDRRVQGVLAAADTDGVEITTDDGSRRVAYDDISKARTVFNWGPTPKPGGPKNTNDKNPEKKAPTS